MGATAIAIGPEAPYQARGLRDRGFPFPVALDPDLAVHDAVGLGRQSRWRYLFNLLGWLRWLRGLARTRRQGRITGHFSTLPGVAVVDASGEVTWVHRGSGLGDYPRLATALRHLARAARP